MRGRYYHLLKMLIVSAYFFVTGTSCEEEYNGNIESVVLYSKPGEFGGEKIYVDIKNKGGVGVRKTIQLPSGEQAEFYNVAIIDDFRSRFKGKKKVCFTTYGVMVATCGAKINNENIPELSLYK